MRTATNFTRWRSLLLALSAVGIAIPLRAANPSGASPTPSVSGSAATVKTGSAALPATSPVAHLPGNDPSLFASSIPLNSTPGGMPPAPDSGVSTSFAVNLLQRLVKRGILSQQDADDLTKQAQADAAAARAQSQADAAAASQAVVTQVSEKVAEMAPPPPPSDETVSVPYVPDNVKQEIADEVKANVMKQALAENWASPRAIPDWVPRFRFSGDIRTRYEGDFYPNTNDATGAFPNFNSINTGAPFDVAGTQFSPQYDVNQDRERFRIRARIAADIDLEDGWTAGIRLASGQDDSPVTENQTLGLANNAQGGDFSKYSVWLDRAFLKYEYQVDGDANKDFSVTVGRMDNPFFSTSMIWARDLGFDGLTVAGRYPVARGVVPFLTMGGYPVFNTDFNFANNQPSKYQSEDKYLFAGQLGANWTINKDLNAKVAGALYYFENIEGHLSNPFTPLTSADQGNTDDSRPSFAQNGNTYFPIRDIVPTAQNDFGTIDQFQYYGLATPFHELDFTGQLNYDRFAPIRISLIGEYVQNLAFNYQKINAVAVNNRGANTTSGALGSYQGGDTAWILTLKVGKPALEKLWDWDLDFGYRYVESDSLVDGFADADFGAPLTGTNLKGYTVGGDLALGQRVWLGLHLMSADSIAGAPYASDIVQFDINGRF
jgi:hypothetical protein